MLLLPTISLVSSFAGIDNGFVVPAMGWSALYGAPFGQVNETKVAIAAEGLNTSGLLALGYNRVNLDDWFAIRDGQDGKIKGDPRNFPSGMAAMSAKVHSFGCLFGVYSAASMRTCANFSASLFNEVNDANTFANDWKIDMLKYDACRYNAGVHPRARYEAMGRALNATGRSILYSVEGWTPESDSSWGPSVANSWRTGSDIWPNWDNHNVCILNNLYQTNFAAKWHTVGKGFNDPDMLQPPNTLITVLSPGLTPEEAYSQFKLWVVMKSPLVLGTNYAQIADLKTLEPTYFGLLTNTEMIDINQDMSEQGRLVRQYPSRAQRMGKTTPGDTFTLIPASLQACDEGRASQRFVPGKTPGTVELDGANLCLVRQRNGMDIVLEPCTNSSTVWGMKSDDANVHVGTAGPVATTPGKQMCMTTQSSSTSQGFKPILAPCVYTGPIPPKSVFQGDFGTQTYGELCVTSFATSRLVRIARAARASSSVMINDLALTSLALPAPFLTPPPPPPVWGPTTKQVVSGSNSMCVTAGLENYGGKSGNNGAVWVTNNGTLEHEVWMGDLTPLADGSRRRVIALFNKAASLDALFAPASLYTRDLVGVSIATAIKVRDVVRKADVAVVPGAPIEANVPSHGVSLYVVTFPPSEQRREL